MHETSKSIYNKLKDSRYTTRYLKGNGIDIGAGADGLDQFYEFFPLMKTCKKWDKKNGDAQFMESVKDDFYDFVHSAHCLEHMRDPIEALNNWIRILKPESYLICIIPDEDLYEQGVFPSTWNSDHKFTFTILKKKSWSDKSISVIEMLSNTKQRIEIKKIELLDMTYRFELSKILKKDRLDQTGTLLGESGIEFVIKKCSY